MKNTIRLLVLLTFILGGFQGLRGQEADQAETPWTATAGLGLMATSGNSDITNLALTFQAVKEMAKSKWINNANLAYASTDGDETANKGGFKTQYDYSQTKHFFYFGKFGVEFDKFTNLDLRTSPGAGVGYVLVKDEKMALSTSVGANIVTDFFGDDTKDTRGMLSMFQEWSYNLTSTATLYQNFNIQNNFEDFGDYLIDVEVSISSKISEALSLKASLLEKYDSTPFSEDLKNNDLTFITSLTYTI